MSALSAMQDKTQHLENSLSAETRIKLDLFSALGDAKRQLEIAQGRRAVAPGEEVWLRMHRLTESSTPSSSELKACSFLFKGFDKYPTLTSRNHHINSLCRHVLR